MSEFKRLKDQFTFAFGGLNTKSRPDTIAPNKYAVAQNVRSTSDSSVRARPGYVAICSTGGAKISDVRGYAALNTNSFPRLLARDVNGTVWLDNSANLYTMAGNTGLGAAMIPFRPKESPQTWMYVGAVGDYRKFSAPDGNNNVTVQKVGIAEPQIQVEACPLYIGSTIFTGIAGSWIAGGNASSPTDGTRSVDTTGAVLNDPVNNNRQSVQVSSAATYSVGQVVKIGAQSGVVVDVIAPLAGNGITVKSIRYASGNTGACVIVPSQIALPNNVNTADFLGGLKRGALLQVDFEVVMVRGLTVGPSGAISIDTYTSNTHSAGGSVAGLPCIVLYSIGVASSPLVSGQITSNLTAGLGTVTQALSSNPFSAQFSAPVSGGAAYPQSDDYLHLSVSFSDPTQLIQMLVMFNLDNGSTYNGNLFYYAIRPGDLVQISNGKSTVLSAILQAAENEIIGNLPTPGDISAPAQSSAGSNQWSEIIIPISSLTRLGADESKTLADCTGIQLQFNMAGSATVSFGSLWVGGGGQPDVGDTGAPYRYQCVPLASLTGARGNPTPLMKYGVNPRRQPVVVQTSALTASDPQVDTWEVYRYGGSVFSYRFVGAAPVGSDFTDDYFDDAATGGSLIEIDNTEPWPSIDVPWKVTAGITAYGQYLVVLASSFPSTIGRWLPGTIFQVGGTNAFTLRSRPVAVTGGYLFEFNECVGYGSQSQVVVLEPNVARQTMPYLWGPDEYGSVFGVGDVLRPGVVSWAKPYGPDAAPTANTLELCPPSEPLLGGRSLSAVSLVASSKRWWQLSFQGNGYSKLEVPVGRRLASPYGMDSDGAVLYFWATDGICATPATGPAKCLTDADLYNLFPHGGISGENVSRFGVTFYAPDFSRAATFRLAVRENNLYAMYEDNQGYPHTLHCDLATMAWSSDVYADLMTVPYAIEQPDAPPTQNYPAVVFGDLHGKLWKVQDFTGDNGASITPVIATFQFDAGDLRATELWGDVYLDCLPVAQISATPVALDAAIGNATLVPPSDRAFAIVSTGGGLLSNFLGLLLTWQETYPNGNYTSIYSWQPSIAEQVETTGDRASDWTNCGTPLNKFFQGVIIDANTFNATKGLLIQDADALLYHTLQPSVLHNGRQTLSYSFVTPFIAHSVRDVPQDSLPWMKYSIEYIFEPTPEAAETWTTQWTALGGKGYKHIPRIEASYSSQAGVTLTIASFDGMSPAPLSLPSTGGVTRKALLTLTLNKGQLYKFSATSSLPFQMFLEDFIIWVKDWGAQGGYVPYRELGGSFGDRARI